ncbi:type I polyketide synthase [Gardnerella vaginalis]|uniref:MaoC-like protein n=2 Tax=Gardnerella vaginalis TaxID=2702 RepID=E3D7L8_GARV3|nr:type I polyketide synthase [Gardnerella vaginalis]ADP39310.1 MaoC-like protein [Gardnerella vaginalis ATCC 14019]KOS09516.1 ACP S-malonyltransferase [Gardnerella vaginalis]TCH80509.1 type I polyketide synthase [Gardnerella vaginalis]SDR77169.1 fatty acid synthase [Gardnerella vaginalis]VEH17507.1 3-oxoacyl-[acyl-carrier-protein] synthase 1 [Gardnerella vaginalis]
MTTYLFDQLAQTPHILTFAGQSTPWVQALKETQNDAELNKELREYNKLAKTLLSNIYPQLLANAGSDINVFDALENSKINTASAQLSVPGITIAQLASVRDLTNLGYNFEVNKPIASLGHSQGIIAAKIVEARIKAGSWQNAQNQIAELIAISYIIGAAADREARMLEISGNGEKTPMLSLKGVTFEQAKALIKRVERTRGVISIAVKNSRNHIVLSGYPEDMEAVQNQAQKESQRSKKMREMKERGGSVFAPIAEYLDVTVPFHSPIMKPAVEQVEAWAKDAGLDAELALKLANAVLVEPVDWAKQIEKVLNNVNARELYVLDMGPGEVLGKLTNVLLQGSGAGVVEVGTMNARAKASTTSAAEAELLRTGCWADFAPRVIDTPAGKKVVTKFSKLTGKAPVLLAGMTPTTVDPEIVAAAANAGYWAELAGGGQVTEEVFDRHMDSLSKQLQEGATVEFNAMFMDRYLWNLQFGSKRIVPKKRASGAPIDGVVISAGIPELDEAKELVKTLQADGFPYVAFKPGTVEQIRQVVRIAKAVKPATIIAQVEGGSAGGHHSWESLDDLLISTYAQVRECNNLVLVAGGGIGTPARAADYISGEWSNKYDLPNMPVDAVMIGTAAMTAKEAHTSAQVKRMLVETPGITEANDACVEGLGASEDPFAPIGERWVPSGKVVGGVTSGLSHLHADIYEIENASARCGRLLVHMMKHPEELSSRRDEVIRALNSTAKPYFGDVENMTYTQFAQRFLDLSYPWADPTYADRYMHLLQRIEARLISQDSGEFTSILPDIKQIAENPQSALDSLVQVFPNASTMNVVPMDAAWFPTLVREYPKPMPFVPVIDNDLLRWWGQDQLWQSEDSRYSADAVRVIPGPISVAGIITMDEPIADILGRFEAAVINGSAAGDLPLGFNQNAFSQIDCAQNIEEYVRSCPNISWIGHVTNNPAYKTQNNSENYVITVISEENSVIKLDLDIKLDTFWDEHEADNENGIKNSVKNSGKNHAVRDIVIPLIVDAKRAGSIPVVDRERLPKHVYNMLAATAGIGNTAITGDVLSEMPKVDASQEACEQVKKEIACGKANKSACETTCETACEIPFGVIKSAYTLSRNLGIDHESATAGRLPEGLQASRIVPDALVGPAWPTIYSALGSVMVDGYPVIEGLLNAVHLDHLIELDLSTDDLQKYVGTRINLTGWAEDYAESASGRVVTIHIIHNAQDGTKIAHETERFAIRGRSYSAALPKPAPEYGDAAELHGFSVDNTPRRALRRVVIRAPKDMTAFARTSGDFNPIHTSKRGAAISGLSAPLVHGMWLSAAAQHVAQALDEKGAHYDLVGWTYNMYGMVQLNDEVEITVERVGKVRRGGLALEITCRVNGQIVSKASALTRAPRAAFVYPGQGIQKQGMSLDERAKSPAVRETWERADKLTREKLGFSILAVVRDNPKELTANGVTYRHPEGLLNLTQFTQVALATVAFAQTARLREAGCDIWPAYFAGHSLGEYNALSSFAQIIPLETVLELVFHRGSTMHHLIERDEQGRSNYRMGALRPNQFGVDDDGVNAYVEGISKQTGEFLQIVNYNLAGQQYAIAGTIKGLKALAQDSAKRAKEYGGKPPFMFVPGIDVPFHSRILRKGVPEFRDKLDSLLPKHIDYSVLVGRYIPNLVACPFELTREFAQKILDVVPSERIEAALEDETTWKSYAEDEQKLGRLLLTELLSWQFASPVRWIETQALMFADRARGGLGVEEYVEVGLGNAPTLANLGAKTLALPEFSGEKVTVYNVGRDEGRVYMTDTDSLVPEVFTEEDNQEASSTADATTAPAAPAANVVSAAPAANAAASGPVADLPFKASDAISMLIAYSAKIRLDQIGDTDTTDTLTNGVSSRRNQLLMDISSELGVASVDGAAEAPMSALKKLVDSVAPRYKAFGAVLSDIVRERLRALFGAAGVKPAQIDKRISEVWQLGEGWRAHVLAALVLQTREGASVRGENLAQLSTDPAKNTAAADALIDAAIAQVAQAHGVSVSQPGAAGAAGGAVVDSAALDAFAQQVVGADGILAATAKFVLAKLGVEAPKAETESDENAAVVSAVEAELGADWPKQVAPRFDERKAILFDDRWASAREDVARLYYKYAGKNVDIQVNEVSEILNDFGSFLGAGEAVASEAEWFASLSKSRELNNLATIFNGIVRDSRNKLAQNNADTAQATRFAGEVAVVTGVAPNSIAARVVTGLLKGGATVIATSHSFKPSVKSWAKKAYRENAQMGAKLWLVPANLSSYRDVDALVKWVGTVSKKVSGATTTILKPAYEPSMFFPFAAPPVHGTLADSGSLFESQSRLMLWGVERAIAGFAQIGADTDVQHRMHVVLPGSPNRGMFGGDGAYGEVKSAFDAIVNRAHAESVWSDRVTFAHPKIGWVRGTGLMGGNDPLVAVVERHGLTTYSTQEMADRLLDLCTKEAREQAAIAPLNVDLTGGLGKEPLDLNALRAEALEDQKRAEAAEAAEEAAESSVKSTAQSTNKALPTPYVPTQPRVNLADWKNVTARPEDEIVIVSVGELGPWGSGRTRFEAELGIREDGSVELSAGAVLELAWNMGLLTWQDSPKPGWYDAEGTLVPEEDIAEKYRDEVVARSGIRPFETGMGGDYKDGANEEEAEIFLDHDVSFSVPTETIAREYVALDESHTEIARDAESGEWTVTRKAGSMIRVPRRAAMTRTVGGQFPKGFDPLKWGIPASMVGSVDTIALWNIVTTVDAYISAGFTPSEILQSVHPSMVASTQGTGFGGMSSMRKLYLDRFLNHEIPTDVLQEALPNVVAAHVMQTYIGGYGNMVQPVSACATAAVSLEEGVDKIALGKADFVVTGAIDDIGVESVVGFGNMNATANSEEMYAKGIDPRFFSRANDRRRGGFLEAQGGGTILVTRGDIALKLGLPVAGVVGFIHSYADGIHTSIPAPGLGALAAGMGGAKSKLVRDLAALGVIPDDIAVVSKHDTSTNANDPNESELHNTLAHAIGRTEGNPLFVISQKTLTGHAKGGACIFQINGLTQLFRSGVIPGNASLDCVDPKLARDDHMVWLREPMRIGDCAGSCAVKVALATSLGFGHVSGFVALVHPGAFEAAVAASAGADALKNWRTKANARLAAGQRRFEEGMMGRSALFEPVENRHLLKDGTRLPDGTRYDGHEAEKAMLLNPDARLDASGYYC